jgi:hypothetical protein
VRRSSLRGRRDSGWAADDGGGWRGRRVRVVKDRLATGPLPATSGGEELESKRSPSPTRAKGRERVGTSTTPAVAPVPLDQRRVGSGGAAGDPGRCAAVACVPRGSAGRSCGSHLAVDGEGTRGPNPSCAPARGIADPSQTTAHRRPRAARMVRGSHHADGVRGDPARGCPTGTPERERRCEAGGDGASGPLTNHARHSKGGAERDGAENLGLRRIASGGCVLLVQPAAYDARTVVEVPTWTDAAGRVYGWINEDRNRRRLPAAQ